MFKNSSFESLSWDLWATKVESFGKISVPKRRSYLAWVSTVPPVPTTSKEDYYSFTNFIDPRREETNANLSCLSYWIFGFVECSFVNPITSPPFIVNGSLPLSVLRIEGSKAGVVGNRFNYINWALLPVEGSLLSYFHLNPHFEKAFFTSLSACILPVVSSVRWNSSILICTQ